MVLFLDFTRINVAFFFSVKNSSPHMYEGIKDSWETSENCAPLWRLWTTFCHRENVAGGQKGRTQGQPRWRAEQTGRGRGVTRCLRSCSEIAAMSGDLTLCEATAERGIRVQWAFHPQQATPLPQGVEKKNKNFYCRTSLHRTLTHCWLFQAGRNGILECFHRKEMINVWEDNLT